jgi:hypothetical protein
MEKIEDIRLALEGFFERPLNEITARLGAIEKRLDHMKQMAGIRHGQLMLATETEQRIARLESLLAASKPPPA